MIEIRDLVKLAIPCFKFLIRAKKLLLVDAFFLNSVEVPARRALLIFPGNAGINVGEGLTTLKPSYASEDALKYLVNALDWSIRVRYEKSFSRFKKFRLSLLFPIAWFRREEHLIKDKEGVSLINDSELNAAISLLKGVLEGFENRLNEVKCEGITYVSLTIKGGCSGLNELVSSSSSVSRNYNWLFKVDAGFRKKLNELALSLFNCKNE